MVKETTDQSNNNIVFGFRLVIPTEQQGSCRQFINELTNSEVMKWYSIYLPTISKIGSQTSLGTILDDLLTYIIQWKLIGHAISK